MAITKIQSPEHWGRSNDTNRLLYKFSSDKFTEPNFQFQFNLKVSYPDSTTIDVGTYNLHPQEDGTVEFNPSAIFSNYLSYDINLASTGLTEMVRGACYVDLYVKEFYGSPPVVITGGWNETIPIYNGCQQNVPYDYTPLNLNGNMKWVMNSDPSLTLGSSGLTHGQFLTDAIEYRLSNDDFLFLWALGSLDMSGFTGRPTKIRYNVKYTNGTKQVYYDTRTPSYEQSVANPYPISSSDTNPYTYTDLFLDLNGIPEWRILPSGGTIVDSQDLSTYVAVFPDGHYYSEVFHPNLPLPDGQTQHATYYSLTGTDRTNNIPTTGVTFYDYNCDFKYSNSIGYYFPCGPYQLLNQSNLLTGLTNDWEYYDIDLFDDTDILNVYPIRVIHTDKCDKYPRWQLFWLNPHGGFDTHIFDKKVDLNYKTTKSTYKRKMGNVYSTYDSGERVFNTKVEEEITLRTGSLTQRESQLLNQLLQSPVVYTLKYYEYNNNKTFYTVPYIVTTSDFRYQQKLNDKEIFMEITLRPSNEKIIQKN